MDNKTKMQYLKLVFLIILLITLTLGATYAFLDLKASNDAAPTGQAGCFEVTYSGQIINSSNLSVTNNYLEGARTEVTLTKSASCQIYTLSNIYIYTNSTGTTAPITDGALKYKVLNGSTLQSEGTITQTDTATPLLENIPLSTTASTYTIYIWVDSNVTNSTTSRSYDNTKYSGYIYAESTQQSTIK